MGLIKWWDLLPLIRRGDMIHFKPSVLSLYGPHNGDPRMGYRVDGIRTLKMRIVTIGFKWVTRAHISQAESGRYKSKPCGSVARFS